MTRNFPYFCFYVCVCMLWGVKNGGVARGGSQRGNTVTTVDGSKVIYIIFGFQFFTLSTLSFGFSALKITAFSFSVSINSVAGRDCPADGGPC